MRTFLKAFANAGKTMRTFEFGSKVKAFAKLGSNKDSRWHRAIYLGNNTVEFWTGVVMTLTDSDIKKIYKLPYVDFRWPDLDNFTKNNWNDLKETANTAVKHFFPELECSFDEKEYFITCDRYTIAPGVKEIESYNSFTETTVWELLVEEAYGGGRWEPPSSDLVDVDYSINNFQIVEKLILAIFKDKSEQYWTNHSYCRLATEVLV